MSALNITDIDECIEDTDGCAQTCTNSIGSYSCSCNSGYRLANNGRGCNGQYLHLFTHRQGSPYDFFKLTLANFAFLQ